MNTLMALFKAERRTVEQAAEHENLKFETPYQFELVEGNGLTSIKGQAQFVMFVIGNMAACGEDGLIDCRVVTPI